VKVSKTERFEKFDICNSKYEYDTIGDTMTLLKHIDKPSLPYHMNSYTYNYCSITFNSSQNNILMNKILCSNYFTIDIIRHNPPDIAINTSISKRTNQFYSILHTRQLAIQIRPPIYQLYSHCIFCSSFIYLLTKYSHVRITLLTFAI